jgi:hypothetical protein
MPPQAFEQEQSMKNILPALALTAASIFSAQPGHASSYPQGVCVKEGMVAQCDTAKPAQKSKPLPIKNNRMTKHRGKNIDPITTCSMGKHTPCTPTRPKK